MKSVMERLAISVAVVAVGGWLAAYTPLRAQAQKPGDARATTLEGTLVDAKCYLGNNALTGNDHGPMKGCGTMCLKGGSPAGLLTKNGQFHAIIAAAGDLAEYVGQTLRVSGLLTNGALLAQKAEVSKGGSWVQIKLSGMM